MLVATSCSTRAKRTHESTSVRRAFVLWAPSYCVYAKDSLVQSAVGWVVVEGKTIPLFIPVKMIPQDIVVGCVRSTTECMLAVAQGPSMATALKHLVEARYHCSFA